MRSLLTILSLFFCIIGALFFLAAFKLSLVTSFQQLDYSEPWCGFLCVYPFLGFIELGFIVCIKFENISAIISYLSFLFSPSNSS